MDKVGIRELRQNLSVHLERVKRGERLEVTEYGRAVALLVPLPAIEGGLERMIAEGRARRATRDLLELPLPIEIASGANTSAEVLDELRWDRA